MVDMRALNVGLTDREREILNLIEPGEALKESYRLEDGSIVTWQEVRNLEARSGHFKSKYSKLITNLFGPWSGGQTTNDCTEHGEGGHGRLRGGPMIDMRALKVGQKVTLSEALPEDGATGKVIELTKWHVSVIVDSRIGGEDGSYLIWFDYDGNVTMFYGWINTALRSFWDCMDGTTPPHGLKIVDLVTE